MMIASGVIAVLAVVSVASAASIGSQSASNCCGPAEWEAMALASVAFGYNLGQKSQSMSGGLSVSHANNLATLYLVNEMMGNNMTVVFNQSQIFIYFMLQQRRQQQQQPDCAAFVLQNVMADLSSSCFPTGQSSPVNLISTIVGSLPVNLLAYEYAGLGGLLAAKMFASSQSCSPMMLSASTPGSGPQLSVLLSGITSGVSSGHSALPAACLGINPLPINVGRMGNMGNMADMIAMMGKMSGSAPDPSSFAGMGPAAALVGALGGNRGGSSSNSPQQWIEDMVTMYVIGKMQSRGGRQQRDLKSVLGLSNKQSSSSNSLSQIVESAASMRLMLTAFSDFIGKIGDNANNGPSFGLPGILSGSSNNNGNRGTGLSLGSLLGAGGPGNSFGDRGSSNNNPSDEIEALVQFLVKMNVIQGLTSNAGSAGPGGNNGPSGPFSQSEIQAFASFLIQQNLMPGRSGSSSSSQVAQLVATAKELQTVESLMQMIKRASLLQLANGQANSGPNFSELLKLAAVSGAVDGPGAGPQGPDFSNLLKLLALQQQQGGRGH